mmetsp:Transcript_36563/g.82659  ORF Transcript_36563/g.82659 Transcript_36563/m.82659 type:complete len:130 (+) Transcript_36563:3-392(+)
MVNGLDEACYKPVTRVRCFPNASCQLVDIVLDSAFHAILVGSHVSSTAAMSDSSGQSAVFPELTEQSTFLCLTFAGELRTSDKAPAADNGGSTGGGGARTGAQVGSRAANSGRHSLIIVNAHGPCAGAV